MTKDSLKKENKRRGSWLEVFFIIWAAFVQRRSLPMVGKWFGNHGKLRQNCIVLKNRTMQDMTDNPRAFYEYLIHE